LLSGPADAGGGVLVPAAWGFVGERAAIAKGPTDKGDASFSPAFVLFGVEWLFAFDRMKSSAR